MSNPLIAESGDDLPVTAERACTSSQIHAAMQHLTLDQQEVIVLRFLEGYNTPKVAVIMNMGPDAVRALQQGALQALQSSLGEETSRFIRATKWKSANGIVGNSIPRLIQTIRNASRKSSTM